jgi:hypothetical protein
MTANLKAQIIYNGILKKLPYSKDTTELKKCALEISMIQVEEILDAVGTNYSVNYWQKVKIELENLKTN